MELSFGGKRSKKKGKANSISLRMRPVPACRVSAASACPHVLL